MKSESERGSSSPHRWTDDNGSDAIDSHCQRHLTITQTSTELTHQIDSYWSEHSFIVSKNEPSQQFYNSLEIMNQYKGLATDTYDLWRMDNKIRRRLRQNSL